MFRSRTPPEAVKLIEKLLKYEPELRMTPIEAMLHPFFDELRSEATRLPNGDPLPDLFQFTREELSTADEAQQERLTPDWYRARRRAEAEAQ